MTGNVNGWAVLGGGIVASDGNNSIDGKPSRPPARLRIVRFSGAMLTYGVQDRSILGVPVRVTSPARTAVDCFRYRDKIGLDVALEALREAVRGRAANVDEIMRAAEVCRARTIIQSPRAVPKVCENVIVAQ